MAIDTLQLAKDLEKDFTSSQAEALARALNLRFSEDIATKADVWAVRAEISELRSELQEVRSEMRSESQDVRSEIKDVRSEMREMEQRLRSEIKDLKVEMVKWIVGALLVNFFGVAGLMMTLLKTVPR